MNHRSIRVIFLMLLAALLVGCGANSASNENSLEGYWMDERANAVTFMGDGSVMWCGSSCTYTIYDSNKVMIKSGEDEVGNYRFSVKAEVLELEELTYRVAYTFYGKESEQKKIMDNLKKAEEAQAEAEAQAEKDYIETNIEAAYEAESNLLNTYVEHCNEKLLQATTEDDKAFYQSEIDISQDRLDLLASGNRKKIEADSYSRACDWIRWHILPEELGNFDKLIFEDNGLQYIDSTSDGSAFIGYMIWVRTDAGDVAPTYGTYAICFSTMSIYEADVSTGYWTVIMEFNLLEN